MYDVGMLKIQLGAGDDDDKYFSNGILQSSVLNDEDAYRRAVKEAFPGYMQKLGLLLPHLNHGVEEQVLQTIFKECKKSFFAST
ncbi:hypothetical protein HanHA300_Chr16g0595541 [Helianthus annuus]|nr:hypothetical protein HanHA300_Chr16g0595541 [Helianthus annuus]